MHTKLDALRRQAEVQFAAQDFEAALASFDAALQIAPDHPGVQAGHRSTEAALARWKKAEVHVARAQDLYGQSGGGSAAVAAAQEEVHLALEAFPEHSFARALSKMYDQHPEHPDHPIALAAKTVALTDARQMNVAASQSSKRIFDELQSSIGRGAGLTYRQFLLWWQRTIEAAIDKGYEGGTAAGSAARDDELQTCMMIWGEVDTGHGLDVTGLATVVQRLAEARIVCLTPDGHVLPSGQGIGSAVPSPTSQRRLRP
jgi:hypothetical protein|eukprot:SAG25_NODE_921_length_4754_cov_3.223416_2_plen_258_part_00